MKFTLLLMLSLSALATAGCSGSNAGIPGEIRAREKKAKPTFMFWCFRKEIVSVDFHVPEMKTPAAAAYLQNHLKAVPGCEGSEYDLATQTLKVYYQSSTIRRMNFEEAIAMAGFAVDNRPAYPNVEIPEGLK